MLAAIAYCCCPGQHASHAHARRSFEEARARLAVADPSLALQRVVLLQGGFSAFRKCDAAVQHINKGDA